jgi:hypothetical protein
VVPIFAPFVVLQAEQLPRFYAGLTANLAVGLALAILAGPSRGYLLMLACAVCGAVTYSFAYDLRAFGTGGDPLPATLALVPVAACYSNIPATLGVALAVLAQPLLSRLRP